MIPEPIVEKIPGQRRKWRVRETYHFTHSSLKYSIHVPAGYVCDLASVPRVFWFLIAPTELSIAAPVLHDFLYQYEGKLPVGTIYPQSKTFTRKEADLLFLELMREQQVPRWKRRLAYLAVRIGGYFYRSNF